MADHVFSAARLRAYRIIEEQGLWSAIDLSIENADICSRLWLPTGLIEIAFRNAADAVLSDVHGSDWLFSNPLPSDSFPASIVQGAPGLCRAVSGGPIDDPVAAAAYQAARSISRNEICRDDVIAHLMLGFWCNRAPDLMPAGFHDGIVALHRCGFTGTEMKSRMDHVLRVRNRIAHHEPLIIRSKHVISRDGNPKEGLALVDSVKGALEKFARDADAIIETAIALAGPAAARIRVTQAAVQADVDRLAANVSERATVLRAERDARRANRSR